MGSASITVHVNRSAGGTIEVERPTLETDRSFELSVVNHGEPVHLHVKPSAELADTVSIQETNRFVDADERITVPVTVAGHTGPVTGRLDLATKFGANAASIEVTLTGGVGDDQRVEIDDRLTTPPRDEPEDPTVLELAADRLTVETLGLAGLVALALLVGLATAVVVGGLVAFLGVAVVLAGVLAALVLIYRDPGAG